MRRDTARTLRHRRAGRAGLAPLELVLCTPMLMMILAMMIIVGTAGAWKVRTLANSRQAEARALWPRTGSGDPKPASWWPSTASMYAHNRGLSPFSSDPFASHTVVRGPFINDPDSGRSLRVFNDTLDLREEILSGYAEIDRDLPLWKQLPYRNHYARDTQVYSGDQWQHGAMRISNDTRRMLITYEYDLARWDPGLTSQMMLSVNQLMANPDRDTLFILDRDDELRSWWGPAYVPYSSTRYDALSFYPPAQRTCTLDLRPSVDDLKARIEHVPRNLAERFRRMYEEQIAALPPGDPQIAVLQQYVDQLTDFLGTVP